MSIITNYFNHQLPPEMREAVYFQLPLRDLLTLPCVCKLFYADLSKDDFFRRRCHEYFPFLESIPNFVSPLVNTLENPWKIICLSLSCSKVNEELVPLINKVADAAQDRFQAYLEDIVQTKIDKYLQDGKKFLNANCLQTFRLMRSEENWNEASSQEFDRLIQEIEQSGRASQLENNLADAFLEAVIISTHWEDFSEKLRASFWERTEDIQFRRFIEVILPYVFHHNNEPHRPLHRLVNKATSIAYLNENKDEYETVLSNEDLKKKYALLIFLHILILLPHFKNWIPDSKATYIKFANIKFNTPEDKSFEVMGNFLPEPIPTIFRYYPTLIEKIENLPRVYVLLFIKGYIARLIGNFLDQEDYNENPVLNFKYLKAFLTSDGSDLSFLYPDFHPDPAKAKEQLEEEVIRKKNSEESH